MKNPNNWRRFSPQLLGSVEKADVKATRVGQLLVFNFVGFWRAEWRRVFVGLFRGGGGAPLGGSDAPRKIAVAVHP